MSKEKVRKWLWWGPHLSERDGGAIVNYYLMNEMNQQAPRDKHWVVPKVPEEFDPSYIPFAEPAFLGAAPFQVIPQLMIGNEIPVVNAFHIGRDLLRDTIRTVQDFGLKFILHQTIHFPNDDIFWMEEEMRKIDCIVAPTNWARKVMIERAKISPGSIVVIPHGVDTSKFVQRESMLRDQLGIRHDQKVFLYTGRLSSWKGVVEIIKMMRHIVNQFDAVFIFRGGPFRGLDVSEKVDYVLTTIAARNPNVIYLPSWRPPAFMEELYAIADFVLFCSGTEGFGVPLIEAMSAQCPFIATSLPNMQEIGGQSGLCGLFIAPEVGVGTVNDNTTVKVPSANSIYGACKWLLENPDEAEIMGKRGRRRVGEHFDLTKVARAWNELYDSMIPENFIIDDAIGSKLYT